MSYSFKDENELKDYTFSEIKKSFEYHYQNCDQYRKFCDLHKINPDKLSSFEDLYSIPQIPTAVFKSVDVCSVDKGTCKCCQSSGTKGIVSKIYRDEKTIRAFLGSIIDIVRDSYGIKNDNCIIYNLGPKEEEAGDLWIAYAMGFLRYEFETYNFVHSGLLQSEKMIEQLKDHDNSKRMVLLGAPALFLRLFEYMDTIGQKLHLPNDAILFTAGGWKSKTGDTLTRSEMCERFSEYFGISEKQYFDIYNQVESNTPFFECKCHNKHIPAGYLVIIRDPVTFEKVEDGQEGVITFLDPSSNSYPAFVITDDIGSVTTDCECGYKGQILHYGRRVKTVETKGCAMKLDQKMA